MLNSKETLIIEIQFYCRNMMYCSHKFVIINKCNICRYELDVCAIKQTSQRLRLHMSAEYMNFLIEAEIRVWTFIVCCTEFCN